MRIVAQKQIGSRPGAGTPDHAFGDKMAGRRAEVEPEQAEATGELERCAVVGKELDDLVGEEGPPPAVDTAAGSVTGQRSGCDTLIEQNIRQLPGIAQAEVEALAGNRVQCLGGVADLDFTALDQRVAHSQGEGETAALAGLGKAHTAAELALQCGEEGVVIEGHHGIGSGRGEREHD